MGVLGIFDIGQKSLNVQRLALEVTGENIANVNTDGYTRQKVVLQTSQVTLDRGFPLGSGVEVGEIQRAYDDFLQHQVKNENTNFGNYDTTRSAMLRVEQVFNDLSSSGLGQSVQDFFNSWQDLSMNPQGVAERQAVLAKANAMVDTFSRISNFLGDVKSDSNKSLEGIVSDVNSMTTQIAGLNKQIKDIEIFGGSANELRDKRDKLVQDLASKVGINYLEQDDGTLSISLMSGPQLVGGNQSSPLSLQANASNSGYYDIYIAPNGGSSKIDVTSIVGGPNNSAGELGAALQVRDVTVNGFQASLDELSYKIASQVNQIHSAGFGLTGSTGNDFFYLPTTSPPNPIVKGDVVSGSAVVNNLSVTNSLFVGMPVSGTGIPAGTTVSKILGPNSVLLSNSATASSAAQDLSFTGYKYSGSGGISVNITNTNDIAAAGSNPTLAGNGTGDNKNALLLGDIKNQSFTMSNGNSTLESFYNAIVGNVGVAKQTADRNTERSTGVQNQLSTLRESVSGVSMDEELANLVKYQKAYEAASKMINTGAEMYDVLLGLIR